MDNNKLLLPNYYDDFVKVYPHKTRVYYYHSPKLNHPQGEHDSKKHNPSNSTNTTSLNDSINISLRRTKTTISDIILCNNFSLFATFTFSPKKVNNRLDPNQTKTIMSNWLKSQQKIHGKFDYLIIPEHHKKGGLHFHCLLSGFKDSLLIPACKKTPSGAMYCDQPHKHKIIKQNGKQIFNIKSFASGFTNVSYILDTSKTSSYVRKYITKDMPLFFGKKRYWSSKGLLRPLLRRNTGLLLNPFIEFKEVYANELYTIFETDTILTTTNYNEDFTWLKSMSTQTATLTRQSKILPYEVQHQPKPATLTAMSR